MAEFKRNAAREADAIARGLATKEEIERRGGLNSYGKYGDSWNPELDLTEEEYAAAVAGTGGTAGSRINAALDAKKAAFDIKKAGTETKPSTVVTPTTTTTPGGMTGTEYNSRMGVYASMAERFNRYGLTALANKIKDLAIKGANEATITLELQDTPEYQERFSANAARIKKGLTALTPSEYVNTEDAYRQVLRSYGLKQFDNDAYIKQFISNDMSPTEFSNRVVTAVQRVQNSDPAILKQLTQYYGVGKNDLVAYVLDPEQQFQEIERRVAAAEIGVAAGRQGLEAGQDVARQLAAQGVSKQEAEQGYATIASRLPAAEKLSDIYGGTMDAYRQSEAEQDVFNSLASAQRKREALRQREIGAFSGSSGVNKTSLASETRGQF